MFIHLPSDPYSLVHVPVAKTSPASSSGSFNSSGSGGGGGGGGGG